MASTAETVRIHYLRPPDREQIFEQRVVHREAGCVVTFLSSAPLREPVRVLDRVVLEHGAPVVWFTFPDLMHDIGRFHLRDGHFTGLYANVLTPVQGVAGRTWHTTDLFLDVWSGGDGRVELLDEHELTAAEEAGWVTADVVARARAEAVSIIAAAENGRWPPAIVHRWTLDRVRAALAD